MTKESQVLFPKKKELIGMSKTKEAPPAMGRGNGLTRDRVVGEQIMHLNDLGERGNNPIGNGSPKPKTLVRMYIRPKTHNGTYELILKEDNVRVRRSLKTKDLSEAIDFAPGEYAKHVREQVALVRPLLEKFFFTYLEAADKGLKRGDAVYKTRIGNVQRMLKVLEYCGIDPAGQDVTSFATKRDGYPICEWYISHRRGNGDSEGAIASTMRQACSLFSKVMMRHYKRQGIDTSWFSDWVACEIEAPEIQPFSASREEEARIVAKCSLLETSRPEMYKAYLLAYGCGMRSSEIRRALYSDFREDYDNETYFLVRNPKAIHGGQLNAVQERVCEREWYDRIKRFGSGDNLIVDAPKKMTLRDFPRFLREECGMPEEVDKPLHRLRKWAGHRIFREYGNNMEVAGHALGHKTLDITRKIYTGRPSLARRRMST